MFPGIANCVIAFVFTSLHVAKRVSGKGLELGMGYVAGEMVLVDQ